MNLIDDTPTQQDRAVAQPGSLGFIPTVSPEIPIETILPSAPTTETALTPSAETQVASERGPAQENEPIYQTPAAQPAKKDDVTSIATQPATPPVPKIVDKSSELTKTHHIQHTQDKLTALADVDEEKFIEKVETAHGHK